MALRDAAVVSAAAAVAVAAILGGAFFPGPRVVVGSLMAMTLGWAVASARGRLAPDEWALIGFIVWGIVAAAVTASAPLAAREVIAVWFVCLVLWLVARRSGETGSQLGMAVLASTAVLLAMGTVLEAFAGGGLRVGGLLENPNVTASLLVVSLPMLLAIDGRPRWRLVAGGVIVLGLVLTGSRAGLLAALAAGAVMLPKGRWRVVGLLGGGLAVAAVLIWRFVDRPDILAWFRPAIWAAVLRLWVTHPMTGVGPGGLVDAAGMERLLHADHVGQRQFLIAYAESSPLGVLVQTGLVGLLIVGAAILLWGRRLRRHPKPSTGMGALLAAMAVMGAFHDLLAIDVVLWWWALTLGWMEATGGQNEPARHGALTRAGIGLGCAFIVLWGVVEPAWARWTWRSGAADGQQVARTLRAEPWYDAPLEWRSRELLRQSAWSWTAAAEAVSQSGRAVRIHPGAARLWSIRGMVQARVVAELGPWSDSVQSAREAFARAVALEPHQPWAWLEWARLERNLGRTDDAVDLVTRALVAEPHTVRARLFLARLELDRGNLTAAREAYRMALESARLLDRRGLNAYERELLNAPGWQFREIAGAVR